MSQKTYDLTQGPILKRLLFVAIPIMGTQLMQMLYNLTDMFWLGRGVSGAMVAASGSAGMYLWLSMGLSLIGRTGAEIGVSQNMGRQDTVRAKAYSQDALFFNALVGTLYGLATLLLCRPLIGFFNIQDAEVVQGAERYLALVAVGIPFTYISSAITGTLNGAGISRLSFFCNAIGLVINMILDPLFIIGLGWGIGGAAVATTTAQIIVCVLFLCAIRFHKSRPFEKYAFRIRPNLENLKWILKWSIPVSLESLFYAFLAMLVSRLIAAFGTQAMTVQKVGTQIESLSWLIGGGFGSAVTAFVGQNYGAGKWQRIQEGYKISMLAMTVWGIIVTLILFFLGTQLFMVFIPEPDTAAIGGGFLRILALCQWVCCLEAVAAGCFRGIGQTLPPSLTSIASNILRVIMAYTLSKTRLGVDAIWWSISISCLIRGIWVILWYRFRRKRTTFTDAEAPARV